tara:strand:+ start:185 stop:1006 length:822 start_codon:yes stop_codon:yes gene_type:complete
MTIKLISEIGINHNGDISLAKKLIQESKKAGFDIVKFQKRDIHSVYTNEYLQEQRESPWGDTQYDQKNGLEFNEDDFNEIDNYCKEISIEWTSSAWDLKSVKFLEKYDLKFNKIASALITNLDLLQLVSAQKKYTFISTGMCTYKDIDRAVEIFKNNDCDFELMHCVSVYPLKPSNANLNAIKTLQNRYKCKVGYSSHESGLPNCFAAVALGASSIEKHVTLDRAMYGSDQSASIEPNGMLKLVKGVRSIELALGDGEKKIMPGESEVIKKLR